MKYGTREICARCGQDIEWLGRDGGWRDRGGNRLCVAWVEKGEIIHPRNGVKHRAPVKFPGWRNMSAAQRYNARKDAIFDAARKRDAIK